MGIQKQLLAVQEVQAGRSGSVDLFRCLTPSEIPLVTPVHGVICTSHRAQCKAVEGKEEAVVKEGRRSGSAVST